MANQPVNEKVCLTLTRVVGPGLDEGAKDSRRLRPVAPVDMRPYIYDVAVEVVGIEVEKVAGAGVEDFRQLVKPLVGQRALAVLKQADDALGGSKAVGHFLLAHAPELSPCAQVVLHGFDITRARALRVIATANIFS